MIAHSKNTTYEVSEKGIIMVSKLSTDFPRAFAPGTTWQ